MTTANKFSGQMSRGQCLADEKNGKVSRFFIIIGNFPGCTWYEKERAASISGRYVSWTNSSFSKRYLQKTPHVLY